ncbi:hypothetical protein ACU8KH_03084 [Lachancea thermotolerans]
MAKRPANTDCPLQGQLWELPSHDRTPIKSTPSFSTPQRMDGGRVKPKATSAICQEATTNPPHK